jgi:dolichol-phosphate mannosyltransferase
LDRNIYYYGPNYDCSMKDLSIIIPTLDEGANIAKIISLLSNAVRERNSNTTLDAEILIVDDNSTDDMIKNASAFNNQKNPSVRVLVREKDYGLSPSVIDGFKQAEGNIILVMDADFSHPVDKILDLYDAIAQHGYDIAIWSRYISGGEINKWPFKRKIISRTATFLSQFLFPGVTDPMSGFFAVKRNVVDKVEFHPLGYKILMEVLGRGRWSTLTEIPFIFVDRKEGHSKLTIRTMVQFVEHVLRLIWYGLTETTSAIHQELWKVFGFAFVGLIGLFVNIGLLYIFTEFFGIYYLLSSVFSIEISIFSNFMLDDTFVFPRSRKRKMIERFFSYQMISIGGSLMTIALLAIFTEFLGIYYLISGILAIFIVFVYNFTINRRITWT